MLREVFSFELLYRKKRPVTYAYFAIIFFSCFLLIASSFRANLGQIIPNAPYLLSAWTAVLSFFLTIITSAVMGVSIVRDFDHNTEAILFTTPMRKFDYLLGRFGGSFITLLFINSGIWMGLMLGFAIGEYMPWTVSWREMEILPFDAWSYFQPFLLFAVVNIFTTGALFFMVGALGRNSIVIYTQGIVLLVMYQLGSAFLNDPETEYIAALLDPFGVRTFTFVTRYWTLAEQNSNTIPLQGIMLYNRLIWMGVGVVALAIAYFGFSFHELKRTFFQRWRVKELSVPIAALGPLPYVRQVFDNFTQIRQLAELSWLYFKMIWREVPFLAIVGCGMLLMFVNATRMNAMYGTSSYPTTYAILTLINSFNLYFLIIATFYSGELIWKERAIKFNMIIDTMPVSGFLGLLSKFMGLVLVYIVLLLVLIGCGVGIQAAYGYYDFNLSVYFGTLYTSTLSFLVLYTLLAIFIQALVNNKFMGFVCCIFFFVVRSFMDNLGLEHDLWQFASGNLGTFSDMNLYGHFVQPFVWFRIYWLSFSMLLLVIAVVLFGQGSEETLRTRWRVGRHRLTPSLMVFAIVLGCTFLVSGGYIFYNTTVLNVFRKTEDMPKRQSTYERLFKQYHHTVQPKIVEIFLRMDLYPASRNFVAEGYYYLKNKSLQPIMDIHVQQHMDDELVVDYVRLDRESRIGQQFPDFRYVIYKLSKPLQPGDSVKMDFKISFVSRGFKEGNSNTHIVNNGTFLSNTYFPHLGYDDSFELNDIEGRLLNNLKTKDEQPLDDTLGEHTNIFGDDADHIRFNVELSTDSDQIAIAPGNLTREWTKNGRHFFNYAMNRPMANFYSIVSARYQVKRDSLHGIKLEIYYHPDHNQNIDRMMQGMKDAVVYYEQNFSPFQYDQIRILEFPRYESFAQSFAGAIPFSEGVGFILKMRDPKKDLDVPYYATAHEVAHQWWGHQVIQAKVRGSSMLSESLSQYASLMVMKHTFPPEVIEHYLKYELDSYLKGRAAERRKELPLKDVEGQSYIHYNKGSLVFFALQDYIGENNLNAALRSYNQGWMYKDTYPTPADLMVEINKVVPDSLRYIIHDMFETITLFENTALRASLSKKIDGTYELILKVNTEKIRADGAGHEMNILIDDWIDVGVYARDVNDQEKLVYLKKHHFTAKENEITLLLKERPVKAGIDPLHKLIDRHSADNIINVVEGSNIGTLPIGF